MDFNDMKRLMDKAVKAREEQYRSDSKRRLTKIIETKIRTSFIGAISAIEKQLQFLWKPDLEVEKSDYEKEIINILKENGVDLQDFARKWEECRKEILTNGNNQIRAINQELNQYTIHWDRYQVNLPVKPVQDKIGG
jgi:hypothetical protein